MSNRKNQSLCLVLFLDRHSQKVRACLIGHFLLNLYLWKNHLMLLHEHDFHRSPKQRIFNISKDLFPGLTPVILKYEDEELYSMCSFNIFVHCNGKIRCTSLWIGCSRNQFMRNLCAVISPSFWCLECSCLNSTNLQQPQWMLRFWVASTLYQTLSNHQIYQPMCKAEILHVSI